MAEGATVAIPGPEILAPGEGLVRLLIADTPMSPAIRDVQAPAGLCILELLERAGVKVRLARLGVVRIDGVEIPRALWERVRPRPGTTVVFGVRPAGGGGGSLRTVLQLLIAVVVVVLIIFQQYWAAALLSAAGNLAVAFIPPPRPRLDAESAPSYAIESARNEARLFQPAPVVLGRRRQVFMFAARPFTEVVGDDLHLRLLLSPGVGPAQIEDIRIGSTPISAFDEVELEIRQGLPGESPISLITTTPVEEAPDTALSIEAGEVVRDVPGGEVDEISVDITFPRGLVRFDGRARAVREVRFELFYRREGEAQWRNVFANPVQLGEASAAAGYPRYQPDLATPAQQSGFDQFLFLFGFATTTDWAISSRETAPVRRSRRWAVPRGRYQVRLRRITPEPTDDQVIDDAVWTAIRGVKAEPPRVPPSTPLVAIRLRASEQLQGQLDPISALVTSIRPSHDPATAVLGADAPTRNPADLFLAIARGPGNSRPLSANRIDFEGLAAWAQLCHARGWTADLVIDDGRSVADALASVAAAGRARPVFNRGRLSVVVDVPRDPSGQVFTPYNTRNFSFRKVFARRPHAYRVSFANEEANYRVDERIVYAPGFDASTAVDFEPLPLEPIVNPDRAAELAAYYIAVSEHRSEEYSFEMDGENAVTEVGARSWLSHDAILEGLGWGRAQAWLDAAGVPLALDGKGQPPAGAEVWGVALDQPLERSPGVAYGAVVRSADVGRFVGVVVAASAAVSAELHFTSPLPGASLRAGDLVSFGLAGQETIEVQVRSKGRPDAQGVVSITCEPYGHPAIDQAAGAPQGPWVSNVRRVWASLPPRPVLNAAVWLDTGVVVDFALPTGPEHTIAGIEVRWREAADPDNPSGWLRLPDLGPADRRATTPPPPLAAAVDLELRAFDALGRRGPALLVLGVASAEPAPAPVVQSVQALSINGPQGSLPSIEIRTIPPTDGRALTLLAQVRPVGAGESAWTGLATFDPAEAVHVAPAAGAPGAALEARLRHETRRGAISAWVGPFAVTMSGLVASNVLNLGARTLMQVEDALDEAEANFSAIVGELGVLRVGRPLPFTLPDGGALEIAAPTVAEAIDLLTIANTQGQAQIAQERFARANETGALAQSLDLLQASVDGNTAAVAVASQAAVDAQGKTNALFGVGVFAGTSRARFDLAADGSVGVARIAADAFLIEQTVGGQVVQPLRVVAGVVELNDALIRNLLVTPSPASTARHRVALRPNRLSGADGQIVAFGGSYASGLPLIQAVPALLAAPPAGAAYDIRAVNVTSSQFQVRAKQVSPGAPVAQTATGGGNAGGTPQWRMHKPTVEDASDGNYEYQFGVQLPFLYSIGGELSEPQFAPEPTPGGSFVYGGEVEIWARLSGVWTLIRREYIESVDTPDVLNYVASVQISSALGQTADHEFGVHPGPGVTILAFDAVRYNTQSTGAETALAGVFSFDVFPPT